MGTCSSTGEKGGELKIQTLVKIQSAGRSYLARKKLRKIKQDKLKTIFSIYLKILNISNIGVERARTESYMRGDPLR